MFVLRATHFILASKRQPIQVVVLIALISVLRVVQRSKFYTVVIDNMYCIKKPANAGFFWFRVLVLIAGH